MIFTGCIIGMWYAIGDLWRTAKYSNEINKLMADTVEIEKKVVNREK